MTRYRKSWTEALLEIRSNVPEKNKEESDYHYGHEPQGGYDHYEDIEESAALQLKMAFDDAGIKIKGVKGGKLVISKKDEKKVEKIIAKQMKKPSDAKRVLGSQIVFEEIELSEKEAAYPSTIENLKKIVKDKQNQIFAFKDGGSMRVDLFSASALVQVYDALKPATKKKFEEMIKTKGGFVASVDFAFKMAKK